MKKLLRIVCDLTIKNTKAVLIVCLVVTLLMGYFMTNLSLELSWVSMAPKGDESVEEYQQIIEDFPSLSSILVVMSTDNKNELDEVIKSTEDKLLELDQYVSSVITGVDRDFMIENGMLLMDEEMIEAIGFQMSQPNIVPFLENINLGLEMQITDLKEMNFDESSERDKALENEDYLASSMRGMDEFFNTLYESLKEDENLNKLTDGVEKLVLGDPYIRSNDGKKILMMIQPNFDVMDYELLVPGVSAIEEKLFELEEKFKGINYEITGMHVVGKDEMEVIESDSYITMIIGIIFILLLLYFAFRLFSAPILASLPLIIGIIWDIGLTAIIIGRLNMMTAFTAIMLIGLGIDFSTHILSGYTEARSKGKGTDEAIEYTLVEIGPSILVGAMTTAAAFLTLSISSLEVLSELGIVMGMGIITTVIAVFFILPSILKIVKGKDEKMKRIKGEYIIIGKWAKLSSRYRVVVSIALIALVIFMGWRGIHNRFDLNVMNLEPKGIGSVELMKEIEKDFGMSSEGILVEKDSIDEVYNLIDKLDEEESVSSVMSIAEILPKEEVQRERLEKALEVRNYLALQPEYITVDKDGLIKQLRVLKKNIVEINSIYEDLGSEKVVYATQNLINDNLHSYQLDSIIDRLVSASDSDKKIGNISNKFYLAIKELSENMIPEDIITLSDIPENYKMQLVSEDEEHFLVNVYPSFEIWENLDKEKGISFIEMARRIDPDFTGSPIFMNVLYDAAKNEVVKAGVIILVTLFLILLLHFKSLKYTALAFIPLIITLILTAGVVELLGIKWNVLNVLAFPLIIGIGIDDAVHILHRYTSTKDSIKTVFSSVGRAILITTLTTMAGFGSLMFSSYRGMAYLGEVLFIGVGFAFLMTVLIIPIFVKDRDNQKNSTLRG